MRALDLIDPRDVVGWAVRMVEQGANERALVSLAGLSAEDTTQLDAELDALVRDLGFDALTEHAAGMISACEVARELNEGLLQPIEAARQIWRIARRAPAVEADLQVFVGLASEWDDDPEHRDLYEEEIRALALNLDKGRL